MFGSLLAAAAPFIIDKIAGGKDDKVPGIPTPEEGSAIGQARLSEMDAAFPGTTAWERLGTSSNQAGAPAAGEAARSAQLMQDKELSNKTFITDKTNRANIISALGGVSPMAAASGLEHYERGTGSDYDTVTQQGTRKTPAEIARMRAEQRITHHRGTSDAARARLATEKAKAELFSEQAAPWQSAGGSAFSAGAAMLGPGRKMFTGFAPQAKSALRRFFTVRRKWFG